MEAQRNITKTRAPVNPYIVAVVSALVAGGVSLLGNYLMLKGTIKLESTKSLLDLRKGAYLTFLERIDRKNNPAISKLLHIGGLVGKARTDSEVVWLDKEVTGLLTKTDRSEVFLQLSSDLNLVRLAGSERIRGYANDLVDALMDDFDAENLRKYPVEIQRFYSHWKGIRDGNGMLEGELKVPAEKIFALILASKLLNNLLVSMNEELRS